MHSGTEVKQSSAARRSRTRAHMRTIVAPLFARGLRIVPQPGDDPATSQVARAFPRSKRMWAVSAFTVIKRCASPMLRRALDDRSDRCEAGV
jgi:hypothetical protein